MVESSRLESAEQIPRGVRRGALAPFSKCALGKRDADALRIVSSRLEMSAMRLTFPIFAGRSRWFWPRVDWVTDECFE
jgi:hypothetical protein